MISTGSKTRQEVVENREAINLAVMREQQALYFCFFVQYGKNVESFLRSTIKVVRLSKRSEKILFGLVKYLCQLCGKQVNQCKTHVIRIYDKSF